jgi:endonuclease/exonuclease/phosphatase family metal-dependent hydrolase
MTIKFLQLNIWLGKYLDRVISYIKKNNFDIVCLQEVAGGEFNHDQRNCFNDLVRKTGMEGQLAIYINKSGDISSYIGNVVLYKREYKMQVNHVIWMKRYAEISNPAIISTRKFAPLVPRSALAILLEKNHQHVMVIDAHLAWGPTPDDAVYKKNQAKKLYHWMKTHVRMPFILAGDFNLNPHTKIVTDFSRLGMNLTIKHNITNTLNPRIHYAKHLFPSGIPVDYVITDKKIRVDKFFVEEVADLSDHFGLVAEFKL